MNWVGKTVAAVFVKSARLLAWVYYSTIRISGTERIPLTGPTLLVANHANSLVDPVILGLAVGRRVRYLAKGPLFEIPVVGGLLRWLGMIPVWRAEDDRSRMRENIKALGDAAQALAGGKAVGIFPEGKSHDLRKLEPLFAGTSRIALQALEAGADELTILPIGVNYSEKDLFRSSVWIQVGEPIAARDFVESHGGAAKAKKALGDEIGERLRSVIIHLDDPEWEPYLEDLEILDPGSEKSRGDVAFSLCQRWVIAGALNHFRVEEPGKVESIGRALAAHHTRLGDRGMRVRSLILRQPGWRRIASHIGRSIQLALGFIPAMTGTIHNLLPFLAERGVVRLIPRADLTTVALTRLMVGIVTFPIWYALVWWWLSLYFLPWVAWAWTLTMPFAGLYALHYFRVLHVIVHRWRAELRMLFGGEFLRERREIQARIRKRISSLSKRYARLRPPLEPAHLPIYRRPALRWAAIWGTTLAVAAILGWAGIRAGFRNYTLPALTAPAFDLTALDADTLEREISTDEETLGEILTTLDDLEVAANRFRSEFDAGKRSFLNPEDTDEIDRLMLTYLNCRNELLRFVWKYRAAGTLSEPVPRLRSSLLVLGSGCALYQAASKLVAMFEDSPNARRKLNEADPTWGIPEDMFDTIEHNLDDRENVRALARELAHYRSQAGQYREHGLLEAEPQARFHATIKETTVRNPGRPNLLVGMLEEIEEVTDDAVYQGQSLVSTWVGSTRVRQREGGPRVTPGHLEEMRGLLRPGDILIERQDFFLSRAFMPGYWAHAAIYVGDAETVASLGLADHQWVAPHWQDFTASRSDILESTPPGVRMTTLDHCIGVADSAAILRPRISEEEVKQAVARAFRDLGKPYDFEFDFFSEDKIVCTELIYRAFTGLIDFELVDVLGRMTLPPTELVRKFVAESGRDDRQFELILFLDGHAMGNSAKKRGAAVFAGTVNRPSLTWLNTPR